MKMGQKSRKPKFGGADVAGNAGINQHKRMAMGLQGPTAVTKNPGSKGSRKPGMKKS